MPSPRSESGSDEWSESEFDENSDFQSSHGDAKQTPGKGGDRGTLKNLPFDEALDVSGSSVAKSEYDNGLDTSLGSMSDAKDTPQRGGGGGFGGGGAKASRQPAGAKQSQSSGKNLAVVKDKPFDEAHSLGDSGDLSSEESVMTNDSEPKNKAQSKAPAAQAKSSAQAAAETRRDLAAAQQAQKPTLGSQRASTFNSGEESSSGSESGSDDESQPGGSTPANLASFSPGIGGGGTLDGSTSASGTAPTTAAPGTGVASKMTGAYNMNDYKHLQVSSEIKDLFQYIQRYKPHEVELDTTLKCFIPDFIPSVGEMDAFIKVPQPDGKADNLGLKVLDEPAAHQSDATVLELQLRAGSKKPHGDLSIRSIENAAKNPAEVEKWIKSIQDLHKMKPAVEVQYKRNMPDVDSLMQEWPEEFEEMLKQVSLPDPDISLTTEEYAKVLCALLDVPVYENIIESLHVVFSLYMAFKDNPHFAARLKEGQDGGPMGGGGMGGGGAEDFGGAQVFTLDESKD